MIIQILSLDMRKALKIALIPPGPDFCTQLHHAHIAVVSYEKFFKILDPIRIGSEILQKKSNTFIHISDTGTSLQLSGPRGMAWHTNKSSNR